MGVLSVITGFFSMTTVYIIVAAVIAFFIYDYWTHTYFRRLGIPGPSPKPLFGNALDFEKPIFEVLAEYVRLYGPVVGIYMWRRPIIVVSDPEILKKIMVKDYHKFYNKYPMPLSSGAMDHAVFLLRDQRWKRVHDVITPTFTGRKMKMMSELINECADMMVENLQQSCEKDGLIDTRELYGSYIMDSVATCAFGLKVNSQKDKNDPFVDHAKRVFDMSFASPVMMAVSFMPSLRYIFEFFGCSLFPKEHINFFTNVAGKAVDLREKEPSSQRVDFLQLLIDARNEKGIKTANENDDDDVHNKYFKDSEETDDVTTRTRKYLTREELLAQSMIFLSAGYETTTALLTYASYLLAMNPQHQEKLITEIDNVTPTRRDVTYETISKMTYLEQVMSEVLRIYPPGILSDREVGETCTINGFKFEKGLQVWMPHYGIQRDPKHWPDPMKFDPDRFTKENREGRNPFTWIPFGAGPRVCVGTRFALMEAKVALVRSLQVVRFEVSPLTKIPPDVANTSLLSLKSSYNLKVVSRHSH